jgi:molybdopterin-containing oxidoreductase family iron-sulfur binding subunit
MSEGRRSTRREVLLAGTVAAGAALTRPALAAEATPTGNRPARRFGLVIDLDRCSRCQACVVACAAENNVPPSGRQGASLSRPIHWMDMLVPQRGHIIPGVGDRPLPIPCLHCERPECVKVCPVGATYLADDGIVAQIWDRCIGCRSCMVACPYSRRYYNWSAPAWPGGDTRAANPDVAVRPAGVVEKCTLCHHRVRDVLARARLDEESVSDEALRRLPACAATCPSEAITFGDLADPGSTVSRLSASPRAVRLLEHLGTGPKVFYLRRPR